MIARSAIRLDYALDPEAGAFISFTCPAQPNFDVWKILETVIEGTGFRLEELDRILRVDICWALGSNDRGIYVGKAIVGIVGDPEVPFWFNWPQFDKAFPDQPAYVAREDLWHFFPRTKADLWQLFEAHRDASAIPDPSRRNLCVGRGQDDFEIAVTGADAKVESCCLAFAKRFGIATRRVALDQWQCDYLVAYRRRTEDEPLYTDLWRPSSI